MNSKTPIIISAGLIIMSVAMMMVSFKIYFKTCGCGLWAGSGKAIEEGLKEEETVSGKAEAGVSLSYNQSRDQVLSKLDGLERRYWQTAKEAALEWDGEAEVVSIYVATNLKSTFPQLSYSFQSPDSKERGVNHRVFWKYQDKMDQDDTDRMDDVLEYNKIVFYPLSVKITALEAINLALDDLQEKYPDQEIFEFSALLSGGKTYWWVSFDIENNPENESMFKYRIYFDKTVEDVSS